MYSSSVGKSYYYYGQGGTLCIGKDGKQKEVVKDCGAWAKGNTVTIFLDCDESKITFWRDEKKLGTLEIDRNVKYYPAMAGCYCMDGGKSKSDYILMTSL